MPSLSDKAKCASVTEATKPLPQHLNRNNWNSCALGSVGFTDFERRRRSAHRLPKILFRTCRPPMRQDQHRCRHSNVASCILYVACSGFPRRMCCCTQHGSHGAGRDNVHAELATTAEPCRQSHPRVLALVRTREYSHWYVFEITAVVRTVFIPQDLRGLSLSMLSRQRKSNPDGPTDSAPCAESIGSVGRSATVAANVERR